jgi:hypothetical protein
MKGWSSTSSTLRRASTPLLTLALERGGMGQRFELRASVTQPRRRAPLSAARSNGT